MEYGLKVRNSLGSLIIDGEYSNYALRSKGAITSLGNGEWSLASVSVSGGSPIIAWRCSAKCMVWRTDKSGGETVFYFITKGVASIDYWLFDEPSYASLYPTSYGFKVKSPLSGFLVFDSRAAYMRVMDLLTPSTSGRIDKGDIIKSYDYRPALVQCQLAVYDVSFVISPSPPYTKVDVFFLGSFFSVSANSISGGLDVYSYYREIEASGPGNYFMDYSYLVLDVTNM